MRNKNGLSSCNIFLWAVLAAIMITASLPSYAAAAVEMRVKPGLGGMYKTGQPVELLITVENNGPALAGMIRVRPDVERKLTELVRFEKEVQIPADTTEQLRMVIPGDMAAQAPVVELVSGETLLAKSRVDGAVVRGGRFILVLGENIMSGGLQEWLSGSSDSQWNVKFLPPGEVPADSLLLGAADVIMIDPTVLPALDGPRVRAIKEWAHLGGLLALFGDYGVFERENGFSDIIPAPLALENGIPGPARRDLGRGQVFYCGVAPQGSGDEAKVVWSALFGDGPVLDENIPAIKGHSLFYVYGDSFLSQASSYIPQLAGPTAPVLFMLWLIYVAAVGPVLYFLLRRVDRRDYAWALAPALALLAGVFFYLLAPAGRLHNDLSHTVAVVDILNPALAEVRAGASVVAPRGGDVTVLAGGNMYAAPAGAIGRDIPVTVHSKGEKVAVNFTGVEYRSLRKAHACGINWNIGGIETRLYLEGGSLKGDLVNKTNFDLRNCRLLLGDRAVEIGELPAGEAAFIEENLDVWKGPAGPRELLFELRNVARQGPYLREKQILMGLGNWESSSRASIQFLGWHDGAPGVFEVAGKRAGTEDYGLVLVKQDIKVELAKGKTRIPPSLIIPYPAGNETVYMDKSMPAHERGTAMIYNIGGAVSTGNIRAEALQFQSVQSKSALPIEYTLKEQPQTVLGSQLQAAFPIEIYDRQTDKWEPLPGGGEISGAAELARYVKDNKVLVRPSQEGNIEFWPGLAVEGEVS